MYRHIPVAGTLSVFSFAMLANAPALAITAKQKMETCQFGADHPNGGGGPALVGKDRKRFIDKCMSNRNDPRGPAVGTPGAQGTPNG
jgi:hypothetical protein